MIDVKDAVKIAMKYFEEIIQYNSTKVRISNAILEEVFLKKYQDIPDCWFITLGFNEEIEGEKDIQNIWLTPIVGTSSSQRRKYKTIIINPDGAVKAMKIREVEHAS